MIANLKDIQKIYTEIPNTWVVNGIQTDTYSQSADHYALGWREVVVPTITEHQRLGDEFILVNDIITKEVIDFTAEEIQALNLQKAITIDLEYTKKISDLMIKHNDKLLESFYNDTVYVIPQSALDAKQALKDECNAKILELGITDFTYRQSVPKLAKVL